ncbi:MAG TPA: dinitrogenase iron-molybdenum cofactor [Thermococcus paralvinellae]|uniref:Dinitrogenase iron-molybdenum cofactor n=1 Tax=Thermococcus paralvinellae TaxID=582419 RepID=A0A832ZF32_9EURY|nr:dinitrogenase iron-molybdenum cofactor [Thermococcus paralvinellae]
MKIAIPSSTKGGLDDTVAPVFARAPVFTIVEVENGEIKDVRTIQNPAVTAPRGAGIMAVQTLINEGVDTIIAPQLGPNALGAIQAAGIRVYTFQPGTPIREAVENVLEYAPQTAQSQITVPVYGYGYGRRRGRGRGCRARLGRCLGKGNPNRRSPRWFYDWW